MSERNKIWLKLLGLMVYTTLATGIAGGTLWMIPLIFPACVFISYWADELGGDKDDNLP